MKTLVKSMTFKSLITCITVASFFATTKAHARDVSLGANGHFIVKTHDIHETVTVRPDIYNNITTEEIERGYLTGVEIMERLGETAGASVNPPPQLALLSKSCNLKPAVSVYTFGPEWKEYCETHDGLACVNSKGGWAPSGNAVYDMLVQATRDQIPGWDPNNEKTYETKIICDRTKEKIKVPKSHCEGDYIDSNLRAFKRNLWALRCKYITFSDAEKNVLNYIGFNRVAMKNVRHPMFARTTAFPNFDFISPWKAPVEPTATCQLPADDYGYIGTCEAGCFGGDDALLVSLDNQWKHFKHAFTEGTIKKVVSLADTADADELQYKMTDAKITASKAWTQKLHDMVIVKTEDHLLDPSLPQIHATPNHPMLLASGTFLEAGLLKPGDELIRADGGRAAVISVIPAKMPGRVYNVKPASKDLFANIVVVGGYLVGSQRVQREEVRLEERLRFRETLNIDD